MRECRIGSSQLIKNTALGLSGQTLIEQPYIMHIENLGVGNDML